MMSGLINMTYAMVNQDHGNLGKDIESITSENRWDTLNDTLNEIR